MSEVSVWVILWTIFLGGLPVVLYSLTLWWL
jgi:hypothetical protein